MHLLEMIPPLAVCAGALLLSRRLLHYFQLESYQFRGFFKTLNRQADRALLPGLVFGAVVFVLLLIGSFFRFSGGNKRKCSGNTIFTFQTLSTS